MRVNQLNYSFLATTRFRKAVGLWLDDVPCIASGRDSDGERDGMIRVEGVSTDFSLFLSDVRAARQPGVVEGQGDGARYLLVERIEKHRQAASVLVRVDVQDSVPVASIGLAQVNDVAVEDSTILFVPRNNLSDSLFGGVVIVETRTAVTSLHAGSVVLHHVSSVLREVLAERLEGCRFAPTVVLDERGETPERADGSFPRTVVVYLPGVNYLPLARERPVRLAVSYAHLRGSVEEVVVGDVEVDALRAQPMVEVRDAVELVPLRVGKSLVAGV